MSDTPLESLESEIADREAALPFYGVVTYPADYPLEVLVDKWRQEEIVIPKFQRRFVWNQNQSSKLIDSFLQGLPVPSIFLYQDLDDPELIVVDGQQRLKSIAYFFSGHFGESDEGLRTEFCLTGLHEDSPYRGESYEGLSERFPAEFAKLNKSLLRAYVIRQLNPADDTSIYHIFERLNTGRTQLLPQEIRDYVHHGSFNDLLIDLNRLPCWRQLFGTEAVDERQRDVELILRFLALLLRGDHYRKPMKNFLNQFMGAQRAVAAPSLDHYRTIFERTATLIRERLGGRPFHIRDAGLNAAVFDSVFVAVARNLDTLPDDLHGRYRALVESEAFQACVTSGTTDQDVVAKRIALAIDALGRSNGVR